MVSPGPGGRFEGSPARPGTYRANEVWIMGLDDKIKNAVEDTTGKGKEATGKATDNERLEAEGKGDQAKADVKQAGEKVKDAFKH